ncbi:transporter substrate-binding domain-containing protein [Treponema sp.]
MDERKLFSVLLCFAALGTFTTNADNFILNSGDSPPRSTIDAGGFEDKILIEAFARLGHTIDIVHLPAERSLLLVNEGLIDGDFTRIKGLESRYPQLLMVPNSFTTMDFVAFSSITMAPLSSWEELKNLRIGYITGWKYIEDKLRGFPFITQLRDEKALFDVLLAGRIDTAIFDRVDGLYILEERRLGRSFVAGPVIEKMPMYLYMNKKHQDLATNLAEKLQNMHDEGLIRRLTNDSTVMP